LGGFKKLRGKYYDAFLFNFAYFVGGFSLLLPSAGNKKYIEPRCDAPLSAIVCT
jgi:hypothetical protein